MKAGFRALSFANLSVLTAPALLAQDCSIPFTEPMFGVQQEMDILYGSSVRYNGTTQELRLNLFKPVDDEQTQRPLIILIPGGGFFDGDRSDLNAMCRDLASKGWAAATISYRLGFYAPWPLSSPFAYDPAEIVRAAYRAQQDARGAVRFLKARSAIDSTSTENVMLMGFSAGAITALHAAYVDDPSKKPAACEAIGPVSRFPSTYPRPDLGPIEGTLNLNGQNEKVLAVASNYGGLLDTSLISGPLDPALYMYHQTGDPTVGCGHQQGLWGMPLGVGDNFPWLYGSCVTDIRIQNLDPAPGRYLLHLYNGNEHAVHDPDAILLETELFLRNLFCSPVTGVDLAARVFLDGPYDASTGLMGDPLRSLGGFPMIEPYTALGYAHAGGGDEFIQPDVLTVTGNDAIVDWVVLELRDAIDPALVSATRSALLQRDGDIVDVDGSSPVHFNAAPAMYNVAVLHRNHLGAMTLDPVILDATPTPVDLTNAATSTYGTEARKSVWGAFPVKALWAGDVNFNGVVKYTGADNDRDPVLVDIGGISPTQIATGYLPTDVNMNGVVQYIGAANDRDIILQSVGGTSPTGTRTEQLP